ncbi:MAG: glycosyltransferase family 4 protein [Nitrospinae bacterium]|nr:glycosyltransferase family 4 protein [Nitrospinota bacterium]
MPCQIPYFLSIIMGLEPKILHINNFCHRAGGTEIYIDRVTRKLQELGYDVSLLFYVQTPSSTEVIDCPKIFLSGIDNSDEQGFVNSAIDILKKGKFDIAYIHNVFNFNLIEALGEIIPVIKFVHDHRFYCPGGAKYLSLFKRGCRLRYNPLRCFFMAYLTKCAMRHPQKLIERITHCSNSLSRKNLFDEFIVFSHAMGNNLKQNGIGDKNITVTNHFPHYIPSAVSKKDRSMLLYAGRISREKGVDYLLDAVAGLEIDYKLIIAGDGYYLPEIKKKASRLGVLNRIELKGWLKENELNDYYDRAAVLVFPSLWPEPFGMAGIEAMAHGTPVVAFNTGAVSEWLIDRETGFLVKPGDVLKMRERIELLLRNEKLAHDMGIAGRDLAEKQFSIEKHIKDLTIATSEAIKRYHVWTGN